MFSNDMNFKEILYDEAKTDSKEMAHWDKYPMNIYRENTREIVN